MRTKLCAVAVSIAAFFSPMLQAETPVYGVIINTTDAPYQQAVEAGLREGATIEEADLYLQTGQSDATQDVGDLCNIVLDRKPNVLLIATTDLTEITSCLDEAKRLDIPVVGISDSADSLENENITSVVFANEADSPHTAGIKAMEQASLAIESATGDDT